MRKWLFTILLSFCFSSFFLQSKAKSEEDWVAIIGEIISWGVGDGLMKHCADYIGCDEYEDMSLSDQFTGLASSNKKNYVCAANSLAKNATRIIGTAVFSFLPTPANYMAANLTGNAIQCVQAIIQSESVKQSIDKYELCYSDPSEGHPLPLTDKQIAKVLPKMNLWQTVENIVAQYSKLCIKKRGDENSYRFYGEGDSFDGVYVHHADGYPYLLCASLFDACPCIFNIQGGKIYDPEYERDKENDFIKIRSDGSLIHKDDTETDRKHEKYYQEHYAKHCRLIRFKEIYEQSNDLASIYSDACFNLHGYSKRQANITVGIVQCFEDTARNIFEKPVLSVNQDLYSNHSSYNMYNNDYSFISNKRNKIKNLLQGRTSDNFSSGDYPTFLASDISKILQLLQEIWFTTDSTSIVSFVCTDQKRAIFSGYKTNIYNKYVLAPSTYSTSNCCSGDSDMLDTCFGDEYGDGSMKIKPSINEKQTDIEIADMFVEIDKIDLLINHIQTLQAKASDAEAIKVSKTGFTLTLFDLLRNKIKVIAIMALVFWVFIIGWKMINGDYGKIKTQEFGMIALKVFLCYMVVFSDTAKDFIFNMAIQTSQGVGMFFSEIMEEFRSQKDNKYSQVCNMKQNSRNTPKNIYTGVIPAERTETKRYICQEWEERICNGSSDTDCFCDEYKMSCQNGSTLNCTKYFKNYDGTDNRNYCKTGTCLSQDGGTKANIYKTGVSRIADEYYTYTFSCPSGSEDYGCTEYKTYFGNEQCIKRDCRKFELSCEAGQTLSCKRYEVLPDGTYGACVSGICIQNKTTFVPLPPMERPYKVKSYYSLQNSDSSEQSSGIITYQPYCHKKSIYDSSISYESSDPPAEQKFSSMLSNNIFVCKEDRELDDGFRIKEYIRHGIIPDQESSILVFQNLLPASELSKSNHEKVLLLKETVVPTAVATSDKHGNIFEYDFVDENSDLNGQQRAKYRIYIKSLFTYLNKNSTYPKIKEYGSTRNYSHLSFWDSLDCKIIQFISMQGFDGGFTEDINDVISGVQDDTKSDKILPSALNGLLQVLKFIFMGFPFGILVFILMFGIGVALFMLVARAAQQYCICVFHLVMLIYLSPFVFLLWLFDQTKNAMKTWIGDVKANILGACVPFVSISMFLFIIDWLFFGDTSKYVSMQLFLPSGEINDNCYEGYLNDAPIACLTKRCLKTFTWLGVLGLNSGSSLYSAESFKMLGYLVLRCLFAAAIVMSMTSLLDRLENAIYDIIGGKPKLDIGVGFNGSAKDAMKTGINAGLGAGKFSLFAPLVSVKAGVGVTMGALGLVTGFFTGIYDLVTGSKIGSSKKRLKKNISDKVKDIGNNISNKGHSISKKTNKFFNTQRWQNHQQRLNEIENNYNNSVNKQNEIKERKIQNITNTFNRQQNINENIANNYANELAQQHNFNQEQIDYLKNKKLAELANENNRMRQNGIDEINREFNQKQNELLQIRNNNKNHENDNW